MSLILAIVGWILIILLGITVALVIYARWNYGTLEALGIPVVKPFLFLGSHYNEAYVDIQNMDISRQKKYGTIYGVYDGRRPQIYISDPKLIRLITTADFDHFRNHGWEFGGGTNSVPDNLLDFLNDEKWKVIRGALTPIFTSGKIKQLNTVVRAIGEDYAQTLLDQCNASGKNRVDGIRFREFVAPMVIEILAKCFCGIEIPNAKDENNEFIKNMKLALAHDIPQENWKALIPKIFPCLNYFNPFPVEADSMDFFVSALKNILEVRGKSGEVSIDATSTLVDMLKKVRSDPTYKRLGIHENVVLAQGWEFFLAGYVGIRDTFDFFMFEMATNPDIQEQAYSEIMSLERGQQLTLEAISSDLPLLNACFMEVTRMHAAFQRPERLCNQDWTYEGIRIPKGMQIFFPLSAIHFNPDHFPNPTAFDPSRFMGETKKDRDPYTYFAFGQGPRNCIGQRFVLEMFKVLIVSFLKKFKIVKRSDTVCEPNPGGTFALTFKPLLLDVVKR